MRMRSILTLSSRAAGAPRCTPTRAHHRARSNACSSCTASQARRCSSPSWRASSRSPGNRRSIYDKGRRKPLEQLVDDVHRDAAWFLDQTAGQTHVVTHSMGGLLARVLINRYRPLALGPVIMLAPPNQGSELADLLVRNGVYRRFFGPAGPQLCTRQEETLRRLFGTVDYPLGIIAGTRSLEPLCWLIIPGPNDGRVSVARTAVAGMADSVTVPATHTFIKRNRKAIRQTMQYLEHGRFGREARWSPPNCLLAQKPSRAEDETRGWPSIGCSSAEPR